MEVIHMESLVKFEMRADEMMNVLKVAAIDDIEKADEDTMRTIMAVIKFIRATTDLIAEQSRTIESMNKKLDELTRLPKSRV